MSEKFSSIVNSIENIDFRHSVLTLSKMQQPPTSTLSRKWSGH